MENDDIQDFDLRWEQALLLKRYPPSDNVLEGLYVSKLQDSSQAQTLMALYNEEFLRGGGRREKLHIEQAQRSKNFRIQNEIAERGAVTKEREQNSFTKRKTGECFQWKANGCCSRGESKSFSAYGCLGKPRDYAGRSVGNARGSGLKPAVGNREHGRKDTEQASSSVPKVRTQTDVKGSKSLAASPAIGV